MGKLILEGNERIIAYAFGLMNISIGDILTQTCMCLTKSSFIFYDDNCYDIIDEKNNFIYKKKLEMPFESIISILFQKYIKSREFNNFYKISFVLKNDEKIKDFFFEKKDKKLINGFIKKAKKISKIKMYKSKTFLYGFYR